MFKVMRAGRPRNYGYVLVWFGPNCPKWARDGHIGWYKYKSDAQHRADVLNT